MALSTYHSIFLATVRRPTPPPNEGKGLTKPDMEPLRDNTWCAFEPSGAGAGSAVLVTIITSVVAILTREHTNAGFDVKRRGTYGVGRVEGIRRRMSSTSCPQGPCRPAGVASTIGAGRRARQLPASAFRRHHRQTPDGSVLGPDVGRTFNPEFPNHVGHVPRIFGGAQHDQSHPMAGGPLVHI